MSLMKKTMNFFVSTKDVDCHDIIKPSAVLDIFQDIAGLHAEELGVGLGALRKYNLAWVILYQHFKIKKTPQYMEDVKVNTWPKPKNRLEFPREYLMTDLEDEELIQGVSNWVLIDLNTRNLVRSDKLEFPGEYYDFTNYKGNLKRRLKLDNQLIRDWYSYEVEYNDLDHNLHMNNARYLDFILDKWAQINTNKYINEVEIAYIKEAKYKDIIRVGHYTIESLEAYIGYVNDELCFECLIGEEEK